jgi:hypothetical protein
MPAPESLPSRPKRIQFTSRTRDHFFLPVDGGMPVDDRIGVSLLVLGDMNDTDDKLGAPRNPAMQPSPVVEVTGADYEKFGPWAHQIIDEQIRQGRIARTDLA